MLYDNLVPVTAQTMSGLGLRRGPAFGFTRQMRLAPLQIWEFADASVSFPIVWIEQDGLRPAAVLGLAAQQNLFVADDGEWRRGHYIPAALRRFPFLLGQDGAGVEQLLIQHSQDTLSPAGAPLFVEGLPTQTFRAALDLCRRLADEERMTAAFTDVLVEMKLLVPREATWRRDNNTPIDSLECYTIDERGFRQLSDEATLAMRQAGFLEPAFAQLHATLNWHRLGDLANSERLSR